MIRLNVEYPGGINFQLDAQLRHLALINNGKFSGSGVTIKTKIRDIQFEFGIVADAEKFELSMSEGIITTVL